MRPAALSCALAVLAGAAFGKGAPDFSAMTPDYTVDVCVLGGGPAGCAAAIAAARNGARVLLVERFGFLGGTMTAAEVNVFMTNRYAAGLFREVLAKLDELHARRGSAYDPNLMKVALDELVIGAGVHVLYYTSGIACTTAPGRAWQGKPRRTITGLVISNKSGLQLVRARVFIDCSGDADLAAWAGAPWRMGDERVSAADRSGDLSHRGSPTPDRSGDLSHRGSPTPDRSGDLSHQGLPPAYQVQPMTMTFRMGGCTFKGGSIMSYPGMQDYWASYAFNPNPGEISLNMTRIKGRSGINAEDLTEATMEGRRQALEAVAALKRNVPGFEHAYLLDLPAEIGVRETRRVMGATVLTGEQIINPRVTYAHRHDVIARNNYDVDLHDPQGTKATLIHLRQPYDIPYRCLTPQGVDNLLVAGRPISADHVANGSARIQATCFALGQAAGTAAAIALKHGVGPWEVGQGDDPTRGQPLLDELQATLIRQGADLGPKRAKELGLLQEWLRRQLGYALLAYPVNRDFSDVPPTHPAYPAVMGVARLGILRGTTETEFGVDEPVTVAVACTAISRARAVLPVIEETPAPEPAALPRRLQGQWYSGPLAECAARGIIRVEDLETLDPQAPVSPATLKAELEAAFGAGKVKGSLPGELIREGQVTRGGLAEWVWECVGGDRRP